jgi:quercetin dioxygenase-like cupin family protein
MRKYATVTKHLAAITALVLMWIPLVGATAEKPVPRPVFEGETTTAAKDGATQPVRVSVQSWEFAGPNSTTHETPLRGFYVAHLLSGEISTTIDGQTAARVSGDYWTVKTGATMQVRVLGEYAVIETIVVSKQ